MKCPSCGKKNSIGSKFCLACGENLKNAVIQKKSLKDNAKKEKKIEKKISGKRKNIFKIISLFIVILILAIGVLKSRKNKTGDVYVFLSDGEYHIISDLSKNTSFTLDSSKNSEINSSLVSFKNSDEYIYYYTKYSNRKGSLYRVNYNKLKENSLQNEKYIEFISSNVQDYTVLNDTQIFYKREDVLYFYNGKDSVQIDKNVFWYRIDGDGKMIYSTYLSDAPEEKQYALYGIVLSDIEQKRKIIPRYDSIEDYTSDFSTIFYIKENDIGECILYVAGFDTEPKKLGEGRLRDIFSLESGEDVFYYSIKNQNTISLYDYVEDDLQKNSIWLNWIREELKSEENNIAVNSLYCYKNGESILVCDEMLGCCYPFYNTVSSITKKIKIEELEDISQVEELFRIYEGDECYYINMISNEFIKVPSEIWKSIIKDENDLIRRVIYTDNEIIVYTITCASDSRVRVENERIYSVKLEKGKPVSVKEIAEEIQGKFAIDKTIYYGEDIYVIGDYSYGDLFAYKDGVNKCIAKDIFLGDAKRHALNAWIDDTSDFISVEKDGILAYTNYQEGYGYELTQFDNNGKGKIIANDVTQYARISDTEIMYISDGDLYVYDGKEKRLLAIDVDYFWSKNNSRE